MYRTPLYCLAVAGFLATDASAQTAPTVGGTPVPANASAPTASPVANPARSTPPLRLARPPLALSLDELADENGREGVRIDVRTNQSLRATNYGNTITAGTVGSGDIAISGGAFAGFSGVGNFVINSGHNNNLQGSLSITIVTP